MCGFRIHSYFTNWFCSSKKWRKPWSAYFECKSSSAFLIIGCLKRPFLCYSMVFLAFFLHANAKISTNKNTKLITKSILVFIKGFRTFSFSANSFKEVSPTLCISFGLFSAFADLKHVVTCKSARTNKTFVIDLKFYVVLGPSFILIRLK